MNWEGKRNEGEIYCSAFSPQNLFQAEFQGRIVIQFACFKEWQWNECDIVESLTFHEAPYKLWAFEETFREALK